MKIRLTGIYMAVLAVFLIIARGTAVHADESALSVKGVAVTPENASDILGDGKAAFDFETNTLKLDGQITSDGMTEGNLIDFTGDSLHIRIDFFAKLVCSEPGVIPVSARCNELTVEGIQGGDFISVYSAADGFFCTGHMTLREISMMFNTGGESSRSVSAGSLDILHSEIRLEGKDPFPGYGLYSDGDISIVDSDVNIGLCTASSVYSENGDLKVNASLFTATDGEKGIVLNHGSVYLDAGGSEEPADLLAEGKQTGIDCPEGSIILYGRSRLDASAISGSAVSCPLSLADHEIGGALTGEEELWDDESDISSFASVKVPGLVSVPAAEPTVQEEGNTEYWTNHTGIICADDRGDTILSQADVIIPRITYELTAGDGETWTKESGQGLAFEIRRSRHDEESVARTRTVAVDGQSTDQYDLSAGSVIVTLRPEYLNGLSSGAHSLKVSFDDGGEVTASFAVAEQPVPDPEPAEPSEKRRTPDTSDHSNAVFWRHVMSGSLLTAVLAFLLRYRFAR